MGRHKISIRLANKMDLSPMMAIYNQAILAGGLTCDLAPKTFSEMEYWFILKSENTPVFVAESDEEIVGYSCLSVYRQGQAAVAGTAEINYYVDFAYHHMGIGGALISHTLSEAARIGYKHIIGVTPSSNKKITYMLVKYGFSLWGSMENIVEINGRSYSHLYYGKHI